MVSGDTPLIGTVLERDGATYRVATAQGEVRAVLRGKAKRQTPRIVVGDRVRLDTDAGAGATLGIAAVEERRSLLARRVPEGRGLRPVAANLDQVLVVVASREPDPIPQLLDRLLVVAEANDLPAAVVLNKTDLDPATALAARMRGAGYPVFSVSARTGAGVDKFHAALVGRVSVVTGPSGVGKSSLLNLVQRGLALRTGAVSARVGRGRHTTVSAVMLPLDAGGFVVDTPGFSEVGLWGITPGELAGCFPEFRAAGPCRYGDCRHIGEPGCAVALGVTQGRIAPDRVESYRALLREVEQIPAEWE